MHAAVSLDFLARTTHATRFFFFLAPAASSPHKLNTAAL
jgi:hypothetical protein